MSGGTADGGRWRGGPWGSLHRLYARLVNAGLKWSEDGASLMAAAVAYSAALSFFPLLLLLIAALGTVLRLTEAGDSAQEEIYAAIAANTSVSLAEQVDQALSAVGDQSAANGLIGWSVLMFTSLLLFVQFSAAFDRIWKVRVPDDQTWLQMAWGLVKQRLVAFLLLTVVGVIVVLTWVTGLVLQAAAELVPLSAEFWSLASRCAGLAMNVFAFTLMFRLLPPRLVTWRGCLRGAVLGAGLWEAGKWVLATYLIGGRYTGAYDVVGSFIAVLLWVYYAAAVIFYAAEFVQAHDDEFPDLPPEPSLVGEPDVPHIAPVPGQAADPTPVVLTPEGPQLDEAERPDRPLMGP